MYLKLLLAVFLVFVAVCVLARRQEEFLDLGEIADTLTSAATCPAGYESFRNEDGAMLCCAGSVDHKPQFIPKGKLFALKLPESTNPVKYAFGYNPRGTSEIYYLYDTYGLPLSDRSYSENIDKYPVLNLKDNMVESDKYVLQHNFNAKKSPWDVIDHEDRGGPIYAVQLKNMIRDGKTVNMTGATRDVSERLAQGSQGWTFVYNPYGTNDLYFLPETESPCGLEITTEDYMTNKSNYPTLTITLVYNSKNGQNVFERADVTQPFKLIYNGIKRVPITCAAVEKDQAKRGKNQRSTVSVCNPYKRSRSLFAVKNPYKKDDYLFMYKGKNNNLYSLEATTCGLPVQERDYKSNYNKYPLLKYDFENGAFEHPYVLNKERDFCTAVRAEDRGGPIFAVRDLQFRTVRADGKVVFEWKDPNYVYFYNPPNTVDLYVIDTQKTEMPCGLNVTSIMRNKNSENYPLLSPVLITYTVENTNYNKLVRKEIYVPHPYTLKWEGDRPDPLPCERVGSIDTLVCGALSEVTDSKTGETYPKCRKQIIPKS